MICKNCEKTITGQFCHHCGQNSNVSKITGAKLINELSESIFQVDRGLLYTIKELTIKPGKSIRDFLNGKRKKHFKPIPYLLFFSTLFFLIAKMTNQNTWINDIILGFSSGAFDMGQDIEIPKLISWFTDNYAYTTLLLTPIFSFASYLSFKKFEPNYFEHIVLNCYVTGHQAIFYTFFALLKTVIDLKILELLPLLFAVSYSFWTFLQFFSEGSRIATIFRSILTYVLYMIFSLVALLLLIGIQDLLIHP